MAVRARRRLSLKNPWFKKRLGNVAAGVALWGMVILTVFPIYWMAISAFRTNSEIVLGSHSLVPSVWRWQNFVEMWQNVNFAPYLRNSLIICLSTMVVAVLFSTFAGYALARFRFPGSGLFGGAVLATQLIPGIMMLLPIYLLYIYIQQRFGIQMVNSYRGMILIYSAFFIPWSVWIIRSFFASIPVELEQAAMIDGCTRFGALWRVIIPLAVPGIVATGIYVFLTAWDELLFAWVLTADTSTQTIPVGLRLYVGNYQNRYDLMMAAATVVTIPVAIMFFAMQRYIISGLTGGAVKG